MARKVTTENKRVREFFLQRNYEFETHNENKERISDLTEEQWKEKVLNETFNGSMTTSKIKSCALIFHDKDYDYKADKLKGLHCHIILELSNPSKLSTIRNIKLPGSEEKTMFQEHNSEILKNVARGYQYLTHRTQQAIIDRKYPYEISEIYAKENWEDDFLKGKNLIDFYIYKISHNLPSEDRQAKAKKVVEDFIERACAGEFISYDELRDKMIEEHNGVISVDNVLIAHHHDFKLALDQGQVTIVKKKKQEVRENKKRKLGLVYICGSGGTGKTVLANELAKEFAKLENNENSIYSSSTGKDNLSIYKNEVVTIFNDYDFSQHKGFDTFLQFFDTSDYHLIDSRYRDKYFLSDYGIITKSEPIYSYFNSVAKTSRIYGKDVENANKQVFRRVNVGIEIEDTKVNIYRYDKEKNNFKIIKTFEFKNLEEFYHGKVREEIKEYCKTLIKSDRD